MYLYNTTTTAALQCACCKLVYSLHYSVREQRQLPHGRRSSLCESVHIIVYRQDAWITAQTILRACNFKIIIHSEIVSCIVNLTSNRPAFSPVFCFWTVLEVSGRRKVICWVCKEIHGCCAFLSFSISVLFFLSVQRPSSTWWPTSPKSRQSSTSWLWLMTLCRYRQTDWL